MDESRDRRKFHPLAYALRRLLKVCGVHHRHLQGEIGLLLGRHLEAADLFLAVMGLENPELRGSHEPSKRLV
jgi:hypothetical protein